MVASYFLVVRNIYPISHQVSRAPPLVYSGDVLVVSLREITFLLHGLVSFPQLTQLLLHPARTKGLQAIIELGFEIIVDFVVRRQNLLQLYSYFLIYNLILGKTEESFTQNIVFSIVALWL